MKRFAALFAFAVAATVIAGCASRQATKDLPPPERLIRAVRQGLDLAFQDEAWAEELLYVERNAFIPDDLVKVGTAKVEVIDRKVLLWRYQDEFMAPAIVEVTSSEASDGLISVSIRYSPLIMKKHKAIEKKLSCQYTFKPVGGKLVLVASIEATE
ncbi:MAG: hypothetical protein E4H02_08730 [Lentisphaerales bacterium]|jgi:hypothetical protein|nr:MAG: hypothetical protein E4H02_08730 [Lentisphaerales bacterium]